MDELTKRIKKASAALGVVENLNELLAMPAGFHEIVKGKRKPIQGHFGRALFPINPEFDTGIEPVTIKRLAKVLIERDRIEETGRYCYSFFPDDGSCAWGQPPNLSQYDTELVRQTLIRFMLYDYACLQNFRMPYKRLIAEVGKRTPGALFKLVKVDKSFLAGPFGSSLVIVKQHEADWGFFEKLGAAIAERPLDEPEYLFKAKLICAYLWDSALVGVSYPKMVAALEDADVLSRGTDPRSFARTLNRQGLRREVHNRK